METIVRANHPLGRWFLVRSNYFRIAGTSSRAPDEPDQHPTRSTATTTLARELLRLDEVEEVPRHPIDR
jgi:hypothetical protein